MITQLKYNFSDISYMFSNLTKTLNSINFDGKIIKPGLTKTEEYDTTDNNKLYERIMKSVKNSKFFTDDFNEAAQDFFFGKDSDKRKPFKDNEEVLKTLEQLKDKAEKVKRESLLTFLAYAKASANNITSKEKPDEFRNMINEFTREHTYDEEDGFEYNTSNGEVEIKGQENTVHKNGSVAAEKAKLIYNNIKKENEDVYKAIASESDHKMDLRPAKNKHGKDVFGVGKYGVFKDGDTSGEPIAVYNITDEVNKKLTEKAEENATKVKK